MGFENIPQALRKGVDVARLPGLPRLPPFCNFSRAAQARLAASMLDGRRLAGRTGGGDAPGALAGLQLPNAAAHALVGLRELRREGGDVQPCLSRHSDSKVLTRPRASAKSGESGGPVASIADWVLT